MERMETEATYARFSSREVRTRVSLSSEVYFSRGTLPTKNIGDKGHYWGT